jgi:Large polyvalent protein-associated domain 7
MATGASAGGNSGGTSDAASTQAAGSPNKAASVDGKAADVVDARGEVVRGPLVGGPSFESPESKPIKKPDGKAEISNAERLARMKAESGTGEPQNVVQPAAKSEQVKAPKPSNPKQSAEFDQIVVELGRINASKAREAQAQAAVLADAQAKRLAAIDARNFDAVKGIREKDSADELARQKRRNDLPIEPEAAVIKKPVTPSQSQSVRTEPVGAQSAPAPQKRLPPEVEAAFIADKNGAEYRYKATNQPAFEDRGDSLRTRSNAPDTADALVKIAESRNWSEIKVRGSETFKREVFIEGASRGLKVEGYKPNEQDWEEVRQRASTYISENSITPAAKRAADFERMPADKAVAQNPELVAAFAAQDQAKAMTAKMSPEAQQAVQDALRRATADRLANGEVPRSVSARVPEGKVIAMGEAPYRFQKEADQSYYVQYERADGQVKEVWGKELKTAIEKEGVKVGDNVRIQVEGAKAVTVDSKQLDQQGKLQRIERIDTKRNEWKVEITTKEKDIPKQRDQVPTQNRAKGR